MYPSDRPHLLIEMNWEKRTASLAVLSTMILVFSVIIAGTSGFVAAEEEAFFEVEIVDYDEEVYQGEEVTVEYKVTNTGEAEDTQDILFYLLSLRERENDVTLGPGEVHEGEFTWEATLSTGDYTLQVMSVDDSDSVTVSIIEEEPPEPAYFQVEITDYEEEVEEGETVTVEFTIENTGEEEGTQEIVFRAGGFEEDTMEMTIGEGESESGEFTWEAEGDGDVDLEVRSEDTSDTVTVTVEEEVEIPGFTLALIIVGAVIAVAIYHKKE